MVSDVFDILSAEQAENPPLAESRRIQIFPLEMAEDLAQPRKLTLRLSILKR